MYPFARAYMSLCLYGLNTHLWCLPVLLFLPVTEARSLILWMLSYRPEDRPTIENILNHPWMKMTSSSSSSSRSSSPAPSTATTSNYHYQSPMQKSATTSSSSASSHHHLLPPSHHHHHINHSSHNHHYYPHHRAPMPSPQLARQVAPKPVKNKPVSPYLTRAALAMASYTPPTSHSRSQVSLSSSMSSSSSTPSPSSSPRSPASLSSASHVLLGTNPNSSGGSRISLLSSGSAASLNGSKSGGGHHGVVGGGASLDTSSPKVPVMNNRRSRLQAASRRK